MDSCGGVTERGPVSMDSGGGGDRQGQSAWIVVEEVTESGSQSAWIVVEEVTDRASQHG